MKNEITVGKTGVLKEPGDKVEAYITKKGKEAVAKIDTKEQRKTIRQPLKKDGSLGQPIIMDMPKRKLEDINNE